MDHVVYFKDMFEPSEDFRKIIFIMFLFQNDVDLFARMWISKKRSSLYGFLGIIA